MQNKTNYRKYRKFKNKNTKIYNKFTKLKNIKYGGVNPINENAIVDNASTASTASNVGNDDNVGNARTTSTASNIPSFVSSYTNKKKVNFNNIVIKRVVIHKNGKKNKYINTTYSLKTKKANKIPKNKTKYSKKSPIIPHIINGKIKSILKK